MSSLNSTSFIGNLVADPVIRTIDNNLRVCNFRIGINETYKSKTTTTFLNISAWNDLADPVVSTLHKGSQVYVSGRLDMSTYDREVTAPESGEVFSIKSDSISIIADEVFSTDTVIETMPDVPVMEDMHEVSESN